jgi:hypothetical protein
MSAYRYILRLCLHWRNLSPLVLTNNISPLYFRFCKTLPRAFSALINFLWVLHIFAYFFVDFQLFHTFVRWSFHSTGLLRFRQFQAVKTSGASFFLWTSSSKLYSICIYCIFSIISPITYRHNFVAILIPFLFVTAQFNVLAKLKAFKWSFVGYILSGLFKSLP